MIKVLQAFGFSLSILIGVLAPNLLRANETDTSFEQRLDTREFIEKMVKEHNFEQAELEALFKKVQLGDEVITSMDTQAEAKPWYIYRDNLVTDIRIQKGVEFWQQHENALARAEQDYGVPAEVIIAILGVETNYGTTQGTHRVLDTLATFGFEYPRRADFFKRELEAFLLLARENDLDATEIYGSYAGAIGQPQFMPSSYRHYAVDYNGSGTSDLRNSVPDVIGSVANYLKENGWKPNQAVIIQIDADEKNKHLDNGKLKPSHSISKLKQRGIKISEDIPSDSLTTYIILQGENSHEHWVGLQNFYTITRYNASKHYAMAVYKLAQKIKQQKQASEQQKADPPASNK